MAVYLQGAPRAERGRAEGRASWHLGLQVQLVLQRVARQRRLAERILRRTRRERAGAGVSLNPLRATIVFILSCLRGRIGMWGGV